MSTAQPVTRSLFQAHVGAARARTDELFALLRPDAIYDRPIAERHRIIFYLGHLEAFDWNQVCRATLGEPSFHPEFDRLFEFGIDPEPGRAASDTPDDWPAVDEIIAYNRRIRDIFDRVAHRAPEEILNVALEHRLMHAETLAYMFHQLPFDRKIPTRQCSFPAAPSYSTEFIKIPAGPATLGRKSGSGFGWDNEFDEHRVHVPGFAVARYKVTNGEFLEFVRQGAGPPVFWTERKGEWFLRGMFEEIPLPLDWPVWVSQDQATRYAHFRNRELMTEAQFHRAAYATDHGTERAYPWGNQITQSSGSPDVSFGNFDFARWDPVPVNATPLGNSAYGVAQTVGNGWEWTRTVFAPFEGFRPIASYPGYSANFFDGQHYVMKGGSPRTAAALLRRSFRNWFRPNYPYVYAAFRLVEN